MRGHARLELAGELLAFSGIDDDDADWWARSVRAATWEPEVLATFAAAVRPGDVVFDVGAYLGPYALLASRLAGPAGRVYAFEPDPRAVRSLVRNVALNRADNVRVVGAAVAERQGSIWLEAQPATSLSRTSEHRGSLAVPATTLAAFCAERGVRPDVVKIDVEGGEAGILTEDSREVLCGARVVLLELHEPQLRAQGVEPAELVARAEGWGRRVVELGGRHLLNPNVALLPR